MDHFLMIDANVGRVIFGVCGGFFAVAVIAFVVFKIITRLKK